jgi:hypothetical protein
VSFINIHNLTTCKGQPPLVPAGAFWVDTTDDAKDSCEHGGFWTWTFSMKGNLTSCIRFRRESTAQIECVNTCSEGVKSIYVTGLIAANDVSGSIAFPTAFECCHVLMLTSVSTYCILQHILSIDGEKVSSPKHAKLFLRQHRSEEDVVVSYCFVFLSFFFSLFLLRVWFLVAGHTSNFLLFDSNWRLNG